MLAGMAGWSEPAKSPSFSGVSLYGLSSRVVTLQHSNSGLCETKAEAASPVAGWDSISFTYSLGESSHMPTQILRKKK